MKAFIGTLVAVSGILAASFSASAQQNPYAVSAAVGSGPSIETTNAATPVGVSSKVLNNFNQKFANATDVMWNPTSEGTSVYFKQNGIATRSTYDAKGALEYTIRTFYGTQVPEKVLNVIRRHGYGLKVLQCTEVTRRNISTNLVKMEDENSYITVQIHADGEVSEYENFRKAK